VIVSGTPVLEADVAITDLGQVDASTFRPAEGWTGPAIVIRGPQRTSFFAAPPTTSEETVQPVIVHALLSVEGKVLEAEPLQTSDPALAQAALQAVTALQHAPARGPFQREVFYRVLFGGQHTRN
jgi:hypothetical protein